jgi:predicted lactoylglutathione lyase
MSFLRDTRDMKITNLVLWVQDATLSYKFYKKLGFEVGEVNDRHALVRCGDFEIQLITMRNEDEFNKDSLASQKGLGMYIRINVENVDDMYAHVQKLGLCSEHNRARRRDVNNSPRNP